MKHIDNDADDESQPAKTIHGLFSSNEQHRRSLVALVPPKFLQAPLAREILMLHTQRGPRGCRGSGKNARARKLWIAVIQNERARLVDTVADQT